MIDFNDRREEEARSYRLPFERLVERVKNERMSKPKTVREAPWWLFLRSRPAMRKATSPLSEVLVVGLVSKTVMPVRVRSDQAFSHKLGVFATDSYATQAILSSATHWLWAVKYGSTLQTRVNYSPSDVFETFPLPTLTDGLSAVGRELDVVRREIMLRRGLGITNLYNFINDPAADDRDVATLRRIHVEVEELVRDAYGWSDIDLDFGFNSFRRMERWSISPSAQTELLDRLLEENHRRTSDRIRDVTPVGAPIDTHDAGTLFN